MRNLAFIFNLACAIFLATSSRADENASFRNDVMAILSKSGCNAGGCHGNANGKASFKLSLRGESGDLDYLALVQDQFNRRIDLTTPEESLILLKATAQLAHEGGQRFKTNSWEYHALSSWIAGGATNDLTSARKLTALEVTPRDAILIEPTNSIQFTATARFSDGSSRDVTSIAIFEPVNPSVQATAVGLVSTDQPTETTVLVRYLDQQHPVTLAFIPARTNFVATAPEPRNYIDRHIFAKLARLRMNPSEVSSDEAFVRRAYLDLLGVIPTGDEARAFVLDTSPSKRTRLIDHLLERPEFADFWALKWMDLLRAEERVLDRKGLELFHRWVRTSILQRKPIDQFAREIIAARGSTYKNPPANFYRATRTPVERAEASAQLFLGTRMQCAQCHNHPFDRWSQNDYYDWQSVFARLKYKVLENRRRDDNDGHEFKGEQIIYLASSAEVQNPRTGKPAKPRFLGEPTPASHKDELTALADWMTSPENPFFAKVQANRIWSHLLGRGIVEPIDDSRASNPPSHPELLEELARDFVNHGYDLRQLIRVIMYSRTYQLSSVPNDANASDESNFARAYFRRLNAEQLLDSQTQLLQVPADFAGYPPGTRAVQLAGALSERRRGEGRQNVDQFLASFGKPPRLLPSECERSCEPTMGQAFQLMNGPLLNDLLATKGGLIDRLVSEKPAPRAAITQIYWSALSREPSTEELARFESHLAANNHTRPAYEDLLWALLNSKEFLFR
ncbi:MAG TPA: DUF1549 and DUF1553 domain-containing protein [Verrucomicrobiae bacterium]